LHRPSSPLAHLSFLNTILAPSTHHLPLSPSWQPILPYPSVQTRVHTFHLSILSLQTAAHRPSSGKPGANNTHHPANNNESSTSPPIRSSPVMPRVQMDDHFPQSHRNASQTGAGPGISSSNSSGSGSQDFFLSSGDLHQPSTMNQTQQGQVRPLVSWLRYAVFLDSCLSIQAIHISPRFGVTGLTHSATKTTQQKKDHVEGKRFTQYFFARLFKDTVNKRSLTDARSLLVTLKNVCAKTK
jgi:hypothetical protein